VFANAAEVHIQHKDFCDKGIFVEHMKGLCVLVHISACKYFHIKW